MTNFPRRPGHPKQKGAEIMAILQDEADKNR